ncbi:XdhC family protein [Comamonas kerstersii]|uniref:XdhC family protein n=1 Tax=Comamonas kerstersii TaxID=225992 RepID=UPI003A94D5C7
MDAIDIEVLRALHEWRRNGEDGYLVTVVQTLGSAPRPVGALLAIQPGKQLVGSVSGGCIEDDLLERCVDSASAPVTQRIRYGGNAQEARRFGLPCHGCIELLLERNTCAEQLAQLRTWIEAGVLVRRTLNLSTGAVQLEPVAQGEALQCDHERLSMVWGPRWRMLLIGAGVLAQYVTAIARSTGFSVTICDPREAYTAQWHSSEVPLLTEMPDDAVLTFRPDVHSCILTLSHDPKLDDLALLEALNSPAFFVGAIGSRQNNAARRQRLVEHFGITAQAIQRLHGPLGLFIDSKTPAEIAVSIMAEVITVKNGVTFASSMTVGEGKDLQERTAAKNHSVQLRSPTAEELGGVCGI